MFNSHSRARALFEHPLNDFKGVQVTRMLHEFYETDPARGFYGGGGIDARPYIGATPLGFAQGGARPGTRNWGAEYKKNLEHDFSHNLYLMASGTSLPLDSNNVTIDPTHKDSWGRPSLRITYRDHVDDLAIAMFMQDRCMEILDAAGAEKSWASPVGHTQGGAHLLGTCRMGDDPQTSVIDKYHRTHDIPNLFLCDGSSMVTSGRGQPTMTIMALAFRAAEHIAAAAKNNEI